jgi:hypothetical protein
MAQCFQIIRQTGQFAAGGWRVTSTQNIQAFGVIGIADDEALNQVPEGDRVRGSIVVYTDQPIYPTKASKNLISDQVQWDGAMHKVVSRAPWSHFGYWGAVLTRITGD